MNTLEFLEWVLPTTGTVVLGLLEETGHGKTRWSHRSYETVDDAAAAAVEIDGPGMTAYFAVNTFGPWYKDKDGKDVIRKKENVVASRALFDDYDVKDKDGHYATKEEAIAGIVALSKALRLTPSVVDSGGGYHTYLHTEEEMDAATWNELALLKRKVTTHLGIHVDNQVDTDSARVLRPVGLYNRKYGTPREVKLLKAGPRYSVAVIRSALQEFIAENEIKTKPVSGFGVIESIPKLDRVAASTAALSGDDWHDNMLKLVASWVSKGNTDEEIIALAGRYTLDDYSPEETLADIQVMIDGARVKGFAPVEVDPTTSAAVATVPTTGGGALIEGQNIPYWPQSGWRWNGTALSRSVKDADGVEQWRPFCRSFIYPLNRIKDAEGTWVIHWRALEKNGDWREFFMPTSELASADLMAKTLAAHEIFLMRLKNSRSDMAEFAENLIETLQAWKIETKTYGQFGWLPDRSGFVMGTNMLTADSTVRVLCDDGVPQDISVDFGRSGTLDEWVSNIDTLYNRKDAEPFQFALCHSMGSVLVELMGSSNWHGLPLAFTGFGGTGKSTACKIACGFYGNPELMDRQTGEQGSTLNAVIKRIALMGSMPMLLDEFSGRTPDELTRTGYALANGRDKERLGTSGKFATVGGQWFKNSFITSNDSILESISKLPAGYRVEATQLRFFEVSLPKDYRSRVFPDVTQTFIENHMDHVYGEACLPYIRFIIKNMDWVRRQLAAARVKFNPKSEEDNKERFYRDTIVTALVAGKIAQKLGLISFDVGKMQKWAEGQVKQLREGRRETNTDIAEHLAAFIATLQGRLIVTKRMGNANANKEDTAFPLRAPAVGRIATESQKAFVTVKSISDWCKEFGVAPAAIRDELDRAGYLMVQADGSSSSRMYIGQGSTVPSGQARCYELNFNKLYFGKALALVPAEEEAG